MKLLRTVLIAVALAIGEPNATCMAEPTTLRVGFLAPMSGDNADLGVAALDGVRLALKELQYRTQTRIDLTVEDERCDGKAAVSALEKLITTNKIQALIHAGCSGSVLATLPIITRHKIPTIVPMASASSITNSSPYLYRVVPSDSNVAIKIINDIKAQKKKNIVIIYEESNYCTSLTNNITEGLQTISGASFSSESYLANETKFTSLLTRLKNKSPDALVFIPNSERNGMALLREKHAMRWVIDTYIPYFTTESLIASLGKDTTNGILSIDTPSPLEILSAEGKTWYNTYIATKSTPPRYPFWIIASYEATRALLHIADTVEAHDRILLSTTFSGLWGEWHFNKNHEIEGISFVIRQVRDGKLTLTDR